MFPVGIDVSKNTLDLCMLYDGIKGRIKTRNIQNNRHSVENILRWLRLQHCSPEDVHVVMEATGVYHERLATELHDAGFRVSLANPHRSREFARGMGIMTKADKMDAYMLACYAFLKKPHRWEPPAPEIRYLGALLRRRDVLLGDALREENRLEKYLSTDTPADIISSCRRMAQLLREEISNIERQIKAHIKASPALHPFCWTLLLESPMAKRKYTFEQRLEVVMHYFATDDGYRITSARFNVPRTQVRMWVAAYDAYGEEGLRPRDKGVSIDPEIRIEAVNAVLSGQISRCQAATKYKLAGSASISRWIDVFDKHGEEGLRSLRVGKKRTPEMLDDPLAVEAAREQSKDKRIQELERKVRFLELRVLYLQKLKASVR